MLGEDNLEKAASRRSGQDADSVWGIRQFYLFVIRLRQARTRNA